jgi:nascent polypeptide-associated complex subunit alpha
MEQMMRRLGMTSEPIADVEEVIVRTRTKEHVFAGPEVTVVTMQGVRTYQVVGQPVVRPRGAGGGSEPARSPTAPAGPPEEDVHLVMDQANVSREEAIEALRAANGEPAEAIMKILARGG